MHPSAQSDRFPYTRNILYTVSNEWRYIAENLVTNKGRGEVHGEPFRGDNMFRFHNRLATYYHRIERYVFESMASGRR